MPQILGRFTKQPAEVLDYDVQFSDWFENREDTYVSHTTEVEDGITMVSSELLPGTTTIRVILSGGTNNASYQVTVLLTTSSGVVKEADFIVKVKAI